MLYSNDHDMMMMMMVQGRAEKVQQGVEEGGPERGADHGVRQARRGLQPRDTCLTVF